MNRIFGFSRNAVALVGIVVAIVLVVLVGMIVIGSAAIHGLMAPGLKADGVSLLALLVTIIVLLSAVFVVLLVLFWCCCRPSGKAGDIPPNVITALLPMLPLMQQLPNLLSNVGVAIFETGKTLQWVQGNLQNAAGTLDALATSARNAPTLRVPDIADAGGGLFFVRPKFTPIDINPLAVLASNLAQSGTDLRAATSYPVRLGTTNVSLTDVGDNLVKAGKTLAQIANALHANPAPPAELLQ